MILVLPGALDLLHRLHHVVRCKELTVFQVHHRAGPGRLGHQCGLHAQVGGDLDHVAYFGGCLHLARVMHVGEQGEAEFLLHLLQHLQSFVQSGTHVELHAAAVVLHEAALVDHGHLRPLAHFAQFLGGAHHDALLLDHARTTDQEQLVAAALRCFLPERSWSCFLFDLLRARPQRYRSRAGASRYATSKESIGLHPAVPLSASPEAIGPTPAGVPVNRRSPGSKVM